MDLWREGSRYIRADLRSRSGVWTPGRVKVFAGGGRIRLDRALQDFGVRVFRYTGSDIWRDVMDCAREAIDSLRNTVGTA